MNNELQNFARNYLKENLSQCTEKEQHRFKQMYANSDLENDVNSVVDNMGFEKLDWAMQQIKRTLEKRSNSKQAQSGN